MLLLLFKQTGPSAIDLKPQLADRKTERPPTKSSFSEIDLYLVTPVGWFLRFRFIGLDSCCVFVTF